MYWYWIDFIGSTKIVRKKGKFCIHIEDLTVRFKNGVTAINHEFKYTEWNFWIIGRKWSRKDNFDEGFNYCTFGTVTLDRIFI